MSSSTDECGETNTSKSRPLRLTLKCVSSHDLIVDGVHPAETVDNLKVIIESSHGIIPSLQRLIYNGAEISDDKILSQVGILDGSTLHLVVRKIVPTPDTTTISVPNLIHVNTLCPVINGSFEQSHIPEGSSMPINVADVSLHVDDPVSVQLPQNALNMETVFAGNRHVSLQKIRKLRMNVMILALTAIGTSLILTSRSLWWILFVALELIGFHGARSLKRESICLFAIVESAVLAIISILLYILIYQSSDSTAAFVIVVLLFGVRLYTVMQAWALFNLLKGVNPDQVLLVLLR